MRETTTNLEVCRRSTDRAWEKVAQWILDRTFGQDNEFPVYYDTITGCISAPSNDPESASHLPVDLDTLERMVESCLLERGMSDFGEACFDASER